MYFSDRRREIDRLSPPSFARQHFLCRGCSTNLQLGARTRASQRVHGLGRPVQSAKGKFQPARVAIAVKKSTFARKGARIG